VVGPEHRYRIHEVVMGIDGDRIRRRRAHRGGRTVIAVGRLLEKKGFAHLLDAAALLQPDFPLERVVVVGDGPLRAELREQGQRLGIERLVDWRGPQPHEQVRDLLEEADLLAMPCVVAPDGDRDSMPVVVKEALAMEVPVVASDEVGLPELVRPEFGRLVPPGDAQALAAAIRDVLERPLEERRRMGQEGRRWVLETCDVRKETAKVSALVASARGESATPAGEAAAIASRGCERT
jgi:colanic acid/amylovoran biosynthesis glycosyltransferase